MEIQNNGDVAVDYLVRQLNASIGFPTYRHELLPQYQSGRDFPPELMFQLDQSALVRLEVVDLLGHVVYTGEQSSSRGDCSLMVDASQLSQGIYMYRIIALAGYQRNVMRGSFQVVR